MRILGLFYLILTFVYGNYMKRDCRAKWEWDIRDGLECPNAAADGSKQIYTVVDSPSKHATMDILMKIETKPNDFKGYETMRKTAFQYPSQRFYIIINPKEIPMWMGSSWSIGLEKLRNVDNIKLLGYIPKNGTRFHQDYILGYQKAWSMDGIYFEGVDYTYYELFKTLKKMINGTVIMNFAKSSFGIHHIQTPHFWYGLADIAVDFVGDTNTFKNTKAIENHLNGIHAAELIYVQDYTDLFRDLYIKKYNGVFLDEIAFNDIGTIAYINKYTKNGRTCYKNIEDTRTCRRPQDILADLDHLGGQIYSEIYPVPKVYTWPTAGMTAVYPTGSQLNPPEIRAKRSRAFVRNLFNRYSYTHILVDDSFYYIPSGLNDDAMFMVKNTEEETLSLYTVNMVKEERPLIMPMYPNEIVGVDTDNGILTVEVTEGGAIIDFKDAYNTNWMGSTIYLEDQEEYRYSKDGQHYRMYVNSGLIFVNNTLSNFPTSHCEGTPYTQEITFNRQTPEQFWNTYKLHGNWLLDDWMYQLFCCLSTEYEIIHDTPFLVDLRYVHHTINNISHAFKLICEERSVFEIAYGNKGKPCDRCMRANKIKSLFNDTLGDHENVIVIYDKPLHALGSYKYIVDNIYENETYYVNQTFIKHDTELWIPIKKYSCGVNVTIDMSNVYVNGYYWDTEFQTQAVDNIKYQRMPCHATLGHVHPHTHHASETNSTIWSTVAAALSILGLLGLIIGLNPHRNNGAVSNASGRYIRIKRDYEYGTREI